MFGLGPIEDDKKRIDPIKEMKILVDRFERAIKAAEKVVNRIDQQDRLESDMGKVKQIWEDARKDLFDWLDCGKITPEQYRSEMAKLGVSSEEIEDNIAFIHYAHQQDKSLK